MWLQQRLWQWLRQSLLAPLPVGPVVCLQQVLPHEVQWRLQQGL
jgi:hypothetical protein